METICLVSCVSKKRDQPCEAKNLYISALFEKSRAWAEQHADRWFILSAKYGLISPESVIPPYEQTLNRMGVADRRAWAKSVAKELQREVRPGDQVVFLAGQKYREGLEPVLRQLGVRVEIPMKHLRIGEQLSWLSHQS